MDVLCDGWGCPSALQGHWRGDAPLRPPVLSLQASLAGGEAGGRGKRCRYAARASGNP